MENDELDKTLALLGAGNTKQGMETIQALVQQNAAEALSRAIALDGRGRSLLAAGRASEGMMAFQDSLLLLKALHEGNKIPPQSLQGALQNQAHALVMVKDYARAIEYGREARELAEKTWGKNSPQAAEALFHLSSPYYSQKDYGHAEQLLLRAMEIWINQPGAPAEQVGTCLNNLGRICEERGQTDLGADYHRRAVEFRRKMPNREDLAFSLGNYGAALASSGRPAEACNALRECVAIYNALGQGDSKTAICFAANLARLEAALQGE